MHAQRGLCTVWGLTSEGVGGVGDKGMLCREGGLAKDGHAQAGRVQAGAAHADHCTLVPLRGPHPPDRIPGSWPMRILQTWQPCTMSIGSIAKVPAEHMLNYTESLSALHTQPHPAPALAQ